MDRPIIFSAPMVLALLEGRKTMTRRLATSPLRKTVAGDRLYVREAWAGYIEKIKGVGDCPWAHYRATDEANFLPGMKWKPSIHMPRWASRLTLIVTGTKIEQLQDINEEDSRAEGVEPMRAGAGADGKPIRTYRTGFVNIWHHIYGVESWLENPEVVAVSFRVVKANIDAPEARAA